MGPGLLDCFYLHDDSKNNPQIWSYRAMQSFHTTSYIKFVGESIPFCIGLNSFQNMERSNLKSRSRENGLCTVQSFLT